LLVRSDTRLTDRTQTRHHIWRRGTTSHAGSDSTQATEKQLESSQSRLNSSRLRQATQVRPLLYAAHRKLPHATDQATHDSRTQLSKRTSNRRHLTTLKKVSDRFYGFSSFLSFLTQGGLLLPNVASPDESSKRIGTQSGYDKTQDSPEFLTSFLSSLKNS
jgi:hypothetical protein